MNRPDDNSASHPNTVDNRADSYRYSDSLMMDESINLPTTVWGGAGNDTITTTSGDDSIFAEARDDLVMAGKGGDSVVGGGGHDTVFGGNGADTCVAMQVVTDWTARAAPILSLARAVVILSRCGG